MPFDVLSFLKPRKAARAGLLEDLAKRLHAGETLDPDHILRQLAECGCDEQQLQAEIDRLERVADLRRVIAAGPTAQRRLDAIEAEIDKSATAFEKAAASLRQLRDKHGPEVDLLQARVREAEAASAKLLEPANLAPADLTQLRDLQQASQDAAEAASVARQDLEHARRRWQEAEEKLPEAEAEAKLRRNCPTTQEAKQRWANAHAARKQQLADSQAAADAARDAEMQAQRAERAFVQTITQGGAIK